uniref:Uncharacterized protein n=1 Tax=Panagrolaimus sp. PS1159 TaxID=55785 RepID=A0AC35FVT1_9BILA
MLCSDCVVWILATVNDVFTLGYAGYYAGKTFAFLKGSTTNVLACITICTAEGSVVGTAATVGIEVVSGAGISASACATQCAALCGPTLVAPI